MSNPFDEVPYPSSIVPETHPDSLATLATLFGMTPPDVTSCRVLELGCGDGINLVSIAYTLPGSQCVGIDLAAQPIAKGQGVVKSLGLKNIRLQQFSIMDITREWGEFDYIIAHGVYSWVPQEVREKTLAICSENLAGNGVAYVSYNAQPGGYIRQMMRTMAFYEIRHVQDPRERSRRAIGFLQNMVDSLKESDPYRWILAPEIARLAQMAPESVYHDDLAEFNTPFYLHEFIERANAYRLQFLAEAEFPAMQVARSWVEGKKEAASGEDVVDREQYLDFTLCRKFRETLLCHREVPLNHELNPERLRLFHLSLFARPVSKEVDLKPGQPEEFRCLERKSSVTTNEPLVKAALLHLASIWPQRILFSDLKRAALMLLREGGFSPDDDVVGFERMLLGMFAGNFIDFHVHVPRFVLKVNDRPVSSLVARWQVREGNIVSTLEHRIVQVDNVLRRLILLVDGTRNRSELLHDLSEQVRSGLVVMEKNGQPLADKEEALRLLANGLDLNLDRMARLALLVA